MKVSRPGHAGNKASLKSWSAGGVLFLDAQEFWRNSNPSQPKARNPAGLASFLVKA
jgi:hypothetical protein